MPPDISRVLSSQRAGIPAERWEGNYSLEALRVSGKERPSVGTWPHCLAAAASQSFAVRATLPLNQAELGREASEGGRRGLGEQEMPTRSSSWLQHPMLPWPLANPRPAPPFCSSPHPTPGLPALTDPVCQVFAYGCLGA